MDIDEETAEEYRPKKKRIYISEDLTLPTPEIPHRGWHDIFEDGLEAINQNYNEKTDDN